MKQRPNSRDPGTSPRAEGGARPMAVARAWPHARFLRTEGLGQYRILRDPQVIDRVVRFLADTDEARPGHRAFSEKRNGCDVAR